MNSKRNPQIRSVRTVLVWLLHICVFAVAAVLAFEARFDFRPPERAFVYLKYAVPVWTGVMGAVFALARLNRRGWRYFSMDDLIWLLFANVAGGIANVAVLAGIGPAGFPRSLYLLEPVFCFLGTAGLRLGVRYLAEFNRTNGSKVDQKRALIYGAGYAGVALLREIWNNPRLGYRVLGFIDDSPEKHGLRLGGVPVLGSGEILPQIVTKKEIETILIATPSATGNQMTRILQYCHAAGVHFKTVPGLGEMIEGKALGSQIREVAVEDLLGRTPVNLDEVRIRERLEGKVVLVTGAAGSIGSELCRQIARFNPATIVGFDIAESPLFEIDREMKMRFPEIPFAPEIGNIQSRARLSEVMSEYKPSAVYHAAAYKHVPLMETHIFEAVENNVFGTYNLALAAEAHGIEDFVLISSDKAVRPTNVMGATKRVSELVLQSLCERKTKFVAVRFGNVLGSNGSVIPIFKKQIAAGGPVTITHPEMRRFFMTIPEACQLVLQAAILGRSGQICVLEMGESVKIVDLAKNLILLSGLRPDVDVKIEFSGIRPGEKLFEELSSASENTVPTQHEKVRIFAGDSLLPTEDIERWLRSLREVCRSRDRGHLVLALKEMVQDYSPSSHLLRKILASRADEPIEETRVTDIA